MAVWAVCSLYGMCVYDVVPVYLIYIQNSVSTQFLLHVNTDNAKNA